MEVYHSLEAYLIGQSISSRGTSGRCKQCGTWHPSLEKDHIIPRHLLGADTDDNIQFICPNCHSVKTALERQTRFRTRVGKNNPMYGRKHSTEWRRNMSAIQTGHRPYHTKAAIGASVQAGRVTSKRTGAPAPTRVGGQAPTR